MKKVLISMIVLFGITGIVQAESLTPKLCKDKVLEACKLIDAEGKDAAIVKIKDANGPFRFADGQGYIWVQNMEGNMIMHPIKPTLDGKALLSIKDVNGVFLFLEFNNICEESGSGWVPYSWPKPGASVGSPKVSFVKSVKLDGEILVVGCGMYDVTGDDIRKQFPDDEVADTE